MSVCQLSFAVISTPIGPYDSSACLAGLHSVQLSKEVTIENFLQKGSSNVRTVSVTEGDNQHLNLVQNWMENYFSTGRKSFPNIEICSNVVDSKSDVFSHKILTTLWKKVPFGSKVSYSELALLSGQSAKSARAVGTVMSNNKIPLVIPCHRVVKSDGKYGNYSKASKNDIKKWLLDHENKSE